MKKFLKSHLKIILFFSCIIIFFIIYLLFFHILNQKKLNVNQEVISEEKSENLIEEYVEESKNNTSTYIKWVDLKCTSNVLNKLSKLDVNSHINNEDIKFNWIELMAYLSCKYGGNFSKFKQSDLDNLINELKSGITMQDLSKNYKLYNYYYESLDAIFHEYIGEYSILTEEKNGIKTYKTIYGLKVFSPIAKGYAFSHYKDFGTSRSYGYKRVHLGNDLLRKYWNSNYSSRIRICRSSWLEPIWWLENWN